MLCLDLSSDHLRILTRTVTYADCLHNRTHWLSVCAVDNLLCSIVRCAEMYITFLTLHVECFFFYHAPCWCRSYVSRTRSAICSLTCWKLNSFHDASSVVPGITAGCRFMTTCGSTSGDKVGIMTTLGFQCVWALWWPCLALVRMCGAKTSANTVFACIFIFLWLSVLWNSFSLTWHYFK